MKKSSSKSKLPAGPVKRKASKKRKIPGMIVVESRNETAELSNGDALNIDLGSILLSKSRLGDKRISTSRSSKLSTIRTAGGGQHTASVADDVLFTLTTDRDFSAANPWKETNSNEKPLDATLELRDLVGPSTDRCSTFHNQSSVLVRPLLAVAIDFHQFKT